jgi:hypothetical protein
MKASFFFKSSSSRAAAVLLAVVLLGAVVEFDGAAVDLVTGDFVVEGTVPLVRRSRAMVFAWTGLLGCGERISGEDDSSSSFL